MRKVFLGILAISTITLSQTSGDISTKVGVIIPSFQGIGGSLELSGNVKFDYDIAIEGNVNLVQGYNLTNLSIYSEDYKLYDANTSIEDKVWKTSLSKGILKDSYLKATKRFSEYGSIELLQKGIHTTKLSYVSPSFKFDNLELSTNTGYSLDYEKNGGGNIVVGHRGDLDFKSSYEIREGLKLKSELGIGISSTLSDVNDTILLVKDNKIAIVPKVELGIEYKKNNLETGAKLEYQKEGFGIEVKTSYDISSEKLGVSGLSLKPEVILSNATKVRRNSEMHISTENLTTLKAGIDLEYKVNDNLIVISNSYFKTNFGISFLSKKQDISTHVELFNPSISMGLKYKF